MALTPRQVAEAFSRHDFDLAGDQIAADVHWDLVGSDPLDGRAAVLAAGRETLRALEGTTTTFERFDVVDGGDRIAVDSLGRYVDTDGTTALVSSCDVYTFDGPVLTAIRSYTAEVPG